MAGFATSFWTPDYAGGLNTLFSKLQQGVVENKQLLTLAKMRADAEFAYSKKLSDILSVTEKILGGFEKDEGASVRKAYECVREETEAAAKCHRNIAININELVAIPFGQWSQAHGTRVQNSQDDLQASLKAHDKQAEHTRKLRSTYFNRCRQLEDLEEEDKLAFQGPDKSESPEVDNIDSVRTSENAISVSFDDEPLDIGNEFYDKENLSAFISFLLGHAQMSEIKVPILGIYSDVSSGAEIVKQLQLYKQTNDLQVVEQIGQDLITHGILRLVGSVGSTFVNSSRMSYQWRPKAFQIAGLTQPTTEKSSFGAPGLEFKRETLLTGQVGEMLSNTLNAQWNPLNSPNSHMPPAIRLRRDSAEADKNYRAAIGRLDDLRCQLEESMIDHLKFMERCELDRLKAVKAIILDFSGAISNAIPGLQSTVDRMMLFHETIMPEGDLRYFLENYRTGYFAPHVTPYENYYNQIDDQIFGIDLEARARADHKRVPSIITTMLTFLDQRYPDLDGDEARQGIWLVEVPLAATHHLRSALTRSAGSLRAVLEKYETPIVASTLKLYLVELPGK